jgi:hypothetical protein
MGLGYVEGVTHDTDEGRCLENASILRDMVVDVIEALEEASSTQEIVLVAPGGDFRVRVTASQFQLNATLLRRDKNGQWVAEERARPTCAVATHAKWTFCQNRLA